MPATLRDQSQDLYQNVSARVAQSVQFAGPCLHGLAQARALWMVYVWVVVWLQTVQGALGRAARRQSVGSLCFSLLSLCVCASCLLYVSWEGGGREGGGGGIGG